VVWRPFDEGAQQVRVYPADVLRLLVTV